MNDHPIIRVLEAGFTWKTQDPFLFCVYHQDDYPEGNKDMGPATSLAGRNIGNDFIKKDGWRMYHGDRIPGFPEHPHRGFETITFVLKGLVDHADSKGAAGRYGNRDVQWMTAGSGLQHSEMFPLLNENKPNPLELFQIWLNLPAKNKMVAPFYKMLWNEMLPRVTITDENHRSTEIDIVAGKIGKTEAPQPAPDSWAANPENEVAIWHIKMEKNAIWQIPAGDNNINRSIIYFEGDSIEINGKSYTTNKIFETDTSKIMELRNQNKTSRLLLLQGKPINEPVIQYGPFVMNSKTEIDQAFSDYRKTHFGGWPWPRPDMVHDKSEGRFAKFEDGRKVTKD